MKQFKDRPEYPKSMKPVTVKRNNSFITLYYLLREIVLPFPVSLKLKSFWARLKSHLGYCWEASLGHLLVLTNHLEKLKVLLPQLHKHPAVEGKRAKERADGNLEGEGEDKNSRGMLSFISFDCVDYEGTTVSHATYSMTIDGSSSNQQSTRKKKKKPLPLTANSN